MAANPVSGRDKSPNIRLAQCAFCEAETKLCRRGVRICPKREREQSREKAAYKIAPTPEAAIKSKDTDLADCQSPRRDQPFPLQWKLPTGMGSAGPQTTKPSWLADPETLREFLTIAVHDLREPLRAIRSSSDLLAEMHGGAVSEREAQCLRFIAEGVDRMETLIRDVSHYCYGELQELDRTETDLQRVLAEATRRLSDELRKNEAVLTYDPLPMVWGDFPGLVTVFRCLIENACKFRGKAAPNIHVGAIQRGSEWLFSIRDNGMGFNPAYQDRVFDPFQRLNGKQYPGSGLGLPLARRIIERHGGRMWAESQLDRGSTFRFTLPVAD